jgi:hypothetical protein
MPHAVISLVYVKGTIALRVKYLFVFISVQEKKHLFKLKGQVYFQKVENFCGTVDGMHGKSYKLIPR